MPAHHSRRPLAALLALGLLLLPLLIAGCGGGGGTATPLGGSFAGRSFAATGLTLGDLLGSLQFTTSATTRTATGTLTATPLARTGARRAAVQTITDLPNCRGTFDPATGALQLTGSVTDAGGATHTFSVNGTLPIPPATVGALSITVDGVTYGPFTFGDNGGSTGGGTMGGGTTGGGTTTTGLTITGSTGNAPQVQNGAFAGTATASQEAGAFTLNGVPYDGQYNVEVGKPGAILSVEIFGLAVTKGQTFRATDPRLNTNVLATATGRFDGDGGTVQVVDASATSITLLLTDVHYTASPGGASGGFTVNGTITAPVSQN